MFLELLNIEFDLWTPLCEKHEVGDYKVLVNKAAKDSGSGFFNLALPKNGSIEYNSSDLTEIKNFYDSKESAGNIILQDSRYSNNCLEDSEYFYKRFQQADVAEDSDIKIELVDDLTEFSKVMAKGFGFEDSFELGFQERMNSVRTILDSKFYLLYYKGQAITCCSYFKRDYQDDYYLMNTTTLPEFRKQGYALNLMHTTINELGKNVYTRTNNPVVKGQLEKFGFNLEGKFQVVSINQILDEK